MNPKISVLMSVYNGEKYLKEAIDSILNQTFKDFEFLIIEDGSTDRSREVLSSFNDNRIRVIYNKKNLGLIKSLNKGIQEVKGEYIARMDADDVAFRNRLQKQLDFMDFNSDIDVCGSFLEVFGAESAKWRVPILHKEIFTRFLFENSIYHPTVFMRSKSVLSSREYYSESYKHAEDNEYWIRLAFKGLKFANIPEVLLKYRVHKSNVGIIHNPVQKANSDKARKHFFDKLNIEYNEENLAVHNLLKAGFNIEKDDFARINKWIVNLLSANVENNVFDTKILKKELARRWFKVCYNSTNKGFFAWKNFKESSISKKVDISFLKKVKFFIRCLIRAKS